MDFTRALMVKRYAQAYVNTAGCILDEKIVDALGSFADFCIKHNSSLRLLELANVPAKTRTDALCRLAGRFDLSDTLRPLIVLLVKSRRSTLLGLIAHKAMELCYQNKSYQYFKVTSATPLSEQQCNKIIAFIKRKVNVVARLKVTVDSSLIAGIRVQNKQWLWEHSIKKELRLLSRPVIH
jgi:ATP synthase F1 delta subunit